MNISNPVLVCVTAQLNCERLINSGKELSQHINKPLYVVTVLNKESSAKEKSAALKTLNILSKKTGCSIDIIYSDNVAQSLGIHINKVNPCHILIGNPIEGGHFFEEFMSNVYSAPVSVVSGDDKIMYTIPCEAYEMV